MQNFEILTYSIIQGITEFIPVSSSAHLYVTEIFFKWKVEGLMYALAAHLGTLIAVIYFEKKNFYLILNKFFLKRKLIKSPPYINLYFSSNSSRPIYSYFF